MVIPGYIIGEQIYENSRIRVFRGHMVRDGSPVIIKALKPEMVNPVNMAKLMYEYQIIRNLDIKGIVRPVRVEQAGGIFAQVMEDTGSISIRTYLQANCPDLQAFFSIAIQLAETLGKIHQEGILHKDLKPDNIVIHPGTGQVKIIDFSMAGHIFHESAESVTSGTSAGTPAYISPEQTGRMNRAIDYRSDLYSLGVVFYEMLTGNLPLQCENPVQLVHAHFTQKPVSPSVLNSEIPPAVSAIIMKLLKKNPEERYQNAGGLLWDLKECRSRWSQTGAIDLFPLGHMDMPGYFQLPQKLYGREEEINILTEALVSLFSGQPGLILVSGYAGIGKTALIHQTLKPLMGERGYYIAGKFDQLQLYKPYVAFIQAFGDLVRQILTESRENLAAWKRRLHRALGRGGAVITEVISEVELIIGPQPPLEALQPVKAQNRFRMAFQRFIRALAKVDHPLVVFLDDLQWADPASLQLITHICADPGSRYLLIIGAYRDNETGGQPLSTTLEEFKKAEIPVRHIQLKPLNLYHSSAFIAGALSCPEEKANPLAEILYRKSGGNPFFLGQLLKSVYDEKLLSFNVKDGCWEWDPASILKLQMPDDIVKFMLLKLKKLPEETRCVLKLAACIGSIFDLKTLSPTWGKAPAQIAAALGPALINGLILQSTHSAGESFPAIVITAAYEFIHDRVHQAAYSLLPEGEKKDAHLRIGRLMLENTLPDELDEIILTAMDHINAGLALINDPAERTKMAEYNLAAGRKAKDSAAYSSALNYFKAGMKLLPDNSWSQHYHLTYNLHLERSQCEYLCGYVETAELLFNDLIGHAGTNLEKANVYGLKMALTSGTGRYGETLELGMKALRLLGLSLTPRPGKLVLAKEILLAKWRLRCRKIAKLAGLPEINDPVREKILELLILMLPAAYSINMDLYVLIILILSNLSMKYGNTVFSSYGYTGYSIVAGSMLGDYKTGHEMEKIVLELVGKYNNSSVKCVNYFVLGAFVSHWAEHAKTGIGYLKKSVHYGIESGELLFTGYALALSMEQKYITGVDLKEVYGECQNNYHYAKRMKLDNLMLNAIIYRNIILNLKGRAGGQFDPGGGDFDEAGILESMKDDKTILMTYNISQIQQYYLYGDYGNALAVADSSRKRSGVLMGLMLSAEYIFYDSLIITAAYNRLNEKQKRKYRKILNKNQGRMKKWSRFCAANFLHKYLLVTAETARLRDRNDAMSLYDRAIQSARENGYIQNEAMANELAARYHLAAGREKVARVYLEDAFRGYCRWGAYGKARSLQEDYPHLLAGTVVEEEVFDPEALLKSLPFPSTSDSESSKDIDLHTFSKAVRDLSGEEDPVKLMQSLLENAMESTGADKGYLVLEKEEELFIEAAKEAGRQAVLTTVSLEQSDCLATTVVRYVVRTRETVVLNDGESAGIFDRDPYIARRRAKSIVCLPVLFQGIAVGVLYLENSLMAGVFTADRLEMLKVLSTQMAYARKLQWFLDAEAPGTEAKTTLVEPLTGREIEVLELIADGMSNKEIAQKLELSSNTVKVHVMNIYGKLGVGRRVQAVARARDLNILDNKII